MTLKFSFVVWTCPKCGYVRYSMNPEEDLSGDECENCQ